MKKEEMVQEVVDRGFNYIKPARISSFIDRSIRTISSKRDWPFLEETATGPAPLEIPELRKVLSVEDTTNSEELWGADRRWLVKVYPGLPDTAPPRFWYLEQNTMRAYPVDEAELEVRYIRRHPILADAEEPLIPQEWQYLAVDLAVSHCLKDDDEGEEARALRTEVEVAINTEMVPALLGRDHQNPGFLIRTGRPGDYL